METTVDSVGRVVIPKPLRDALGLAPGVKVDISLYGAGLSITPGGRTARIVEEDGLLVAVGGPDGPAHRPDTPRPRPTRR